MFKLSSQKYNTINKLNWILAVISFFTSLYLFFKLPDIIPSHFDFYFQIDSFGSKMSIWISPFLFIALKIICAENRIDFLFKKNSYCSPSISMDFYHRCILILFLNNLIKNQLIRKHPFR